MILALCLFAGAFFLFAFACAIYVAYRFLSLALSMDAAFLKEFSGQQRTVQQALSQSPIQQSSLKKFSQDRMTPTEGTFEPFNDEEAFLNEQVDRLRQQGLSEEECNEFIRQAVGTSVGSPEEQAG